MTNSGSPTSAQRIVNINEFIYEIKEGQIKNYNWDTSTSSWVPHGAITSVSGNAVSVSGNAVSVSGNAVSVSGNAVSVSGNVVYVATSGMIVTVSGNVAVVSGTGVRISGETVTTINSLLYQVTTMSGVTLGSGNLVSGGYTSTSLVATSPIYYKYASCTVQSGTPAVGTVFKVVHIPAGAAGGFASGIILTSAAFTSASVISVPPVQQYMLMSGDTINITSTSNNISGVAWNARIVFGQ